MCLHGWCIGTENLHGLLHAALRLDRWCDDEQWHGRLVVGSYAFAHLLGSAEKDSREGTCDGRQ